jgi:hypothetical protein
MDEYIPKIKTRNCKKCNQDLPLEFYKKKYSHINRVCYNCLKVISRESNRKVQAKIDKIAGDCWWIKAFCSESPHLKK